MILAIYNIIVFIFIGYMAKVLRLLGNRQSGILLGFLLNFALPAQVFNGTYHAAIDIDFLYICIVAFFCNLFSVGILFGIGKFLHFNKGNLIILCFMGMLGNTLYLGMPFTQGILGEAIANRVVIYDEFVTGIPFAFLVPIFLSMTGKGRFSFLGVIKNLLKSPLFLGLVCGLSFRLLPVSIPEVLFTPLKSLAQTATPLALFAIGVQIEFKGLFSNKLLMFLILLGKMFLAPLLLCIFVWSVGYSFNPGWKMALIEVAMPPLVSSIAFMAKAGLSVKTALNIVVLGILISFASIPFWLFIIEQFEAFRF